MWQLAGLNVNQLMSINTTLTVIIITLDHLHQDHLSMLVMKVVLKLAKKMRNTLKRTVAALAKQVNNKQSELVVLTVATTRPTQ